MTFLNSGKIFKLLFVVFSIGPLFCYAQQPIKGQDWNAIKKAGSGTIHVLYYDFKGIAEENEYGQASGVGIDLLQDFKYFLMNNHGVRLTLKFTKVSSWKGFIEALQKSEGVVMGVGEMPILEKYKKLVSISPQYISTPIVLVSHKNAPELSSTRDLETNYKGYTCELDRGSYLFELMEALKKIHSPSIEISDQVSKQSSMKKITANSKIFTLMNYIEYDQYKKQGMPIKHFNVLGSKKYNMGIAMTLNSKLSPLSAEFINQYKGSAKYRKMVMDDLGASFLSFIQ